MVPQMCWLVYAASGVVCRWAWERDGWGPDRGGLCDRVYEEGGGKLLSLSCLHPTLGYGVAPLVLCTI